MKQVLLILGVFLGVTSCDRGKTFAIEGTIEGVEAGEVLYLEREGIEGTQVLDSVEMAPSGDFEMKALKPDYPDFYRLRIGRELVHFCVDSNEVQQVRGQRQGLSGNYTISGNVNSQKMKEIVDKQRRLQQTFLELKQGVGTGLLSQEVAQDSLENLLSRYREDMRLNYIFSAPDKMYAYYALFQQVDGLLLFEVNSKRDISLFQAVGTCMDTYWPEALRTKNLHNVVMKGLMNLRVAEARNSQRIPAEKIKEAGVIEIKLSDRKGVARSLTSLEGKVVLLDFVLQADKSSIPHNLFLRELYNKYKDQGFEIFQVSEDVDQHYWRTVSDALPWICVVEDDKFPGAVASAYNIEVLPTMFLISRENILLSRYTSTEGLEEALKKQL